MAFPSNAMFFMWQGNQSNNTVLGYDIVMSSVPDIKYAGHRTNTYTVDYRDGAIIQPIGRELITISFDVTYVGDLNEREFIKKMNFFFTCPMARVQGSSPFCYELDHKGKLIISKDMANTGEIQEFLWYDAVLISEIDFKKFYEYKTVTLTFTAQPTIHRGYFANGEYVYHPRDVIYNIVAGTYYTIDTFAPEIVRNDRSPRISYVVNMSNWATISTAKKLIIQVWGPTKKTQMKEDKRYCFRRYFIFDLPNMLSMFTGVTESTITIDTDKDTYNLVTYNGNNYETYDVSKYLIVNDATEFYKDYYRELNSITNEYIVTNAPTNFAIKLQLGPYMSESATPEDNDRIQILLRDENDQDISCNNCGYIMYYVGDHL